VGALRNALLLDVDELAHLVPRVGLSCSNVSIDGLLLFLFLVPAVSGVRGGHACEQVVPQQRGADATPTSTTAKQPAKQLTHTTAAHARVQFTHESTHHEQLEGCPYPNTLPAALPTTKHRGHSTHTVHQEGTALAIMLTCGSLRFALDGWCEGDRIRPGPGRRSA